MKLKQIRLVGTEKDGTAPGTSTAISVTVFLWKGTTKLQQVGAVSFFPAFPITFFNNLAGLPITHASMGMLRSSPTIDDEGFVEFIDVNLSSRRFKMPFGDINGLTFGVLLLGSFKSPITIKIPQTVAQDLFPVPALAGG